MDSNAPIESAFPRLKIRDFSLLPVVQGGMGVGISGHRLAGSVAREGAVGTIASVELRRLHPDLMERAGKSRDHGAIAATNLEALDREVQAAREIAGPGGFIAVNVMRAVKHYADLVRQACRSGLCRRAMAAARRPRSARTSTRATATRGPGRPRPPRPWCPAIGRAVEGSSIDGG